MDANPDMAALRAAVVAHEVGHLFGCSIEAQAAGDADARFYIEHRGQDRWRAGLVGGDTGRSCVMAGVLVGWAFREALLTAPAVVRGIVDGEPALHVLSRACQQPPTSTSDIVRLFELGVGGLADLVRPCTEIGIRMAATPAAVLALRSTVLEHGRAEMSADGVLALCGFRSVAEAA